MAGGSIRRRGSIITEINVTPLVDIMLVLLIIFMLTAHLIAKQAIEVELPRASQSTTLKPTTLAITLTREGKLFLDDKPVAKAAVPKVVVRAGTHKLVAMLEGYETWVQQVDVPEQDVVTVNVALKKKPAERPAP